jgi:hypothetical protein
MKITIHRDNTDLEYLVPQDEVTGFVENYIQPGECFTIGKMYPDGWYEREYRKGETPA